jgi:hypothetical protein
MLMLWNSLPCDIISPLALHPVSLICLTNLRISFWDNELKKFYG